MVVGIVPQQNARVALPARERKVVRALAPAHTSTSTVKGTRGSRR